MRFIFTVLVLALIGFSVRQYQKIDELETQVHMLRTSLQEAQIKPTTSTTQPPAVTETTDANPVRQELKKIQSQDSDKLNAQMKSLQDQLDASNAKLKSISDELGSLKKSAGSKK